MPIFLCIDTAGETATIVLGNELGVIAYETNTDQKNHASFVQPALQKLLEKSSVSFTDINAISVVNGPGSYTGLRVGLASAKGIAYAANAPLILLNTLAVMAFAAIETCSDTNIFYCPLIDARRNEVFTAVYDAELNPLLSPQPLVLEPDSFTIFLDSQKVVFFGSGHNKCGKIINHKNAVFTDIQYSADHILRVSLDVYAKGVFADIAYSEPFYTKDFFSPADKTKF